MVPLHLAPCQNLSSLAVQSEPSSDQVRNWLTKEGSKAIAGKVVSLVLHE